MKNIFICAVFFLTWISACGDIEFCQGKWEKSDSVREISESTVGKIYEFKQHKKLNLSTFIAPNSKSVALSSIQTDLLRNSTWKKMKRFIVFEFKIRMQPIWREVEDPLLYFTLFSSSYMATAIKEAKHVKNFVDMNSDKGFDVMNSIYKKSAPKMWSVYSQGRVIAPIGDLLNIRFIIDAKKNGFVSYNINGYKVISFHNIKFPDSNSFRSLGIMVKDSENTKHKKHVFLEISAPRFFMTDNESDLAKLPPVEKPGNIYDNYNFCSSNPQKNKINPDEIYAYGIKELRNGNIIEAVKLFKEAEKHKHILATYKLSEIYRYGVGVDKDIDTALKFLRKACEYKYSEAIAAQALFQMQEKMSIYYVVKNSLQTTPVPVATAVRDAKNFLHKYPSLSTLSCVVFQKIFNQNFYNFYNNSLKWNFFWNFFRTESKDYIKKMQQTAEKNQYLLENFRVSRFLQERCEYESANLLLQKFIKTPKIMLEYQLNQLLSKKTINDFFTADNELNYGTFPLYWILKYQNDKNLNLSLLQLDIELDKNYEKLSDYEKFISGILKIQLIYDVFFDFPYNEIKTTYMQNYLNSDIQNLKIAFDRIQFAALKKISPAEFFMAVIYLEAVDKHKLIEANSLYSKSINYLEKSDLDIAKLQLLEIKIKKKILLNSKELDLLGDFCHRKSARAWYLAGILSDSNHKLPFTKLQTSDIFIQSGDLGEINGYKLAADIFYRAKDFASSRKYCQKYLELLNEKRLNDPYDIFIGENIKSSIYGRNADGEINIIPGGRYTQKDLKIFNLY